MVAREKNTIHERHLMSCWQTFSMAKKTKKHRRRSTRGERRSHRRRTLSLDTHSGLTKGRQERHPKSHWQTWPDGKEDEAAQKTFHARRTKISQEKNLKGRTAGTVTDSTAPHITKADGILNNSYDTLFT